MEVENGSLQDDRFLYNRVIFHFHDYGRKGIQNLNVSHSATKKQRLDFVSESKERFLTSLPGNFQATRPEDVEEILSKISDFETRILKIIPDVCYGGVFLERWWRNVFKRNVAACRLGVENLTVLFGRGRKGLMEGFHIFIFIHVQLSDHISSGEDRISQNMDNITC